MHAPCNRFCLPPKSQILAVFSSPTKKLLPAITPLSSRYLPADNYGIFTVDTR